MCEYRSGSAGEAVAPAGGDAVTQTPAASPFSAQVFEERPDQHAQQDCRKSEISSPREQACSIFVPSDGKHAEHVRLSRATEPTPPDPLADGRPLPEAAKDRVDLRRPRPRRRDRDGFDAGEPTSIAGDAALRSPLDRHSPFVACETTPEAATNARRFRGKPLERWNPRPGRNGLRPVVACDGRTSIRIERPGMRLRVPEPMDLRAPSGLPMTWAARSARRLCAESSARKFRCNTLESPFRARKRLTTPGCDSR